MNELLSVDSIRKYIKSSNINYLTSIEIFDVIDSTNSYLIQQAKLGACSGSICLAEQQTHGRGRLGRSWFSPFAANIYCSILWYFKTNTNISALSIVIAVILTNVLQKYGVTSGIQLKWPNDVLFSGRKLAGILLERINDSGVVIGIGLNLALPQAEPTWIDLSEITNMTPRRNFLAGLLLNELLGTLPIFEKFGAHSFMDDWRAYDALLHKSVTIHTINHDISGIMRGINERGELLLEDEYGARHAFCYGEASVRAHRYEL